MTKKHSVDLTEEQIEIIDYAISQLENNLEKDYPNDADIRRSLKNKYKTISKNINESLKRELYLSV
tara:strand:- start:221 stop:418 length:198 start_codon:yes stop_codon:yes gene_type:complete